MTTVITPEKGNSKRGKRDENLSHQPVGSMHEAHRLEGKVKNISIKNIGHQKKKPKAE